MKAVLLLSIGMALVSCGYAEQGSDLTGQVKKVINKTPLVCNDYVLVDLSLGVMRNGVGSMSHEDVELVVPNSEDVKLLKSASDSGSLVKITYNTKRLVFCVESNKVVTTVELLK